jgi:hypothetical protein
MEDISAIGIGAGGGITAIIIIALFKFCYKKQLHSKFKSACCETVVDVEDNSSPIK